MGSKRRKGRLAGLLVLVATLAFFGCGNRAQDGLGGEREPGSATSGGADREQGRQEEGAGKEADREGEKGSKEEDGIKEEGTKEGGTKGEGAKEEGAKEGRTKEEGAKEGGAKEEEANEAGMKGQETGPEPGEEGLPWSGKKVSICGDSISTFTGYIPDNYSQFYPQCGEIPTVEETWWMQVMERTGFELCSNASFSGSTVSGQSQDNHEGTYACGNQRIADLAGPEGSWPDVILVLMGTNDLLYSIPMGAYDGTSQVEEGYIQTFSEAYGLMLDKMHMWYPDAKIYCCTIMEVSQWDDAGNSFPFQNEHGLTAKNYNDCIKAVAQAKGAAVIDVFGCGVTYENAMEYTRDGVHPNAAGAALIADKVCEGLGAE